MTRFAASVKKRFPVPFGAGNFYEREKRKEKERNSAFTFPVICIIPYAADLFHKRTMKKIL